MFTGIVEELGEVISVTHGVKSARLSVKCPLVSSDASLGDSIAINGCCLTVIGIGESLLTFDAVPETLRCTNLGDLTAGDSVNLERPMVLNGRLGGHFVQGHVDGVGLIRIITEEDNALVISIEIEKDLQKYLISKGSITVDGISLTVAKLEESGFSVWIIPHTSQVTTMGKRQPGDRVNIECDMLGKYIERLVQFNA